MSATFDNELRLRSYLLGDLTSEEQERIEQNLMTDFAAHDELGSIEADLIDDYLEGTLSEQEKERFESLFLAAPERRQQVHFAQALKRYIAGQKANKRPRTVWSRFLPGIGHSVNPGLAWSLAACLLFILVGGSLAALHIFRLQSALDQADSQNQQKSLIELQKRNDALSAALQREQANGLQPQSPNLDLNAGNLQAPSPLRPGQIQSTLLAVSLAPGLLRDAGAGRKIEIPAGTDLVQFDLKMEPQDYPRHQATLQRVGEDRIWTQISAESLPGTKQTSFQLNLPVQILKPGDYVLKLSGIPSAGETEDIGSYYFRIVDSKTISNRANRR